MVPACFFPVTDRPWLTHLADSGNRQDRELTAIVHNSSDPQRIGVLARRSQWIRDGIGFEDFARFVDNTIAAAIELFGELAPSSSAGRCGRCCATPAQRAGIVPGCVMRQTARMASSAEWNRPSPSSEGPVSASMACSGWGIKPTTRPSGELTPAMSRREPLTLSR